jgi:Response regulator containing a CheY-like receiver domain and an HTH DNA-binding domain
VRILLVDDHPLVREGLLSVLQVEPENEVVGQASSTKEAIRLIQGTMPDIALVDLRLKGGCGFDIIDTIKSQGLMCKFIVLTSSTGKEDFQRAEKMGVEGYILKEALPEEIIYAIRIVGQGRKYIDPSIMEFIANRTGPEFNDGLTPREHDVLAAIGSGMNNREIAGKLYITEYTVKKHVSQILYKLNLNDRTQAAIYANSKGLVG